MTELETRLRDLTEPTTPGAEGPTLRLMELEAAARRRRHRSGRVLAAAAAIVVVFALAVVIVRRPQPAMLDTASIPTATTPATAPFARVTVDGHVWEVPDDPTEPNVLYVRDVDHPDTGPPAEILAILRQRLDAIGATDAILRSATGGVDIVFAPGTDLSKISTGLLIAGLPFKVVAFSTGSYTLDTQP